MSGARLSSGDIESKSVLAQVHARMFGCELAVQLGRYEVQACVGRGAMGAVYAAYDPKLDRRVALKVMSSEALEHADGQARARLLREARALARLAHPNVVAVYDAGTLPDGQVWIAMELVDGVSLDRWLAQAPRPASEILDVFMRAARGLGAAHAAGLVHRDFKPSNVVVAESPSGRRRVRVVDFGVARFVADASTHPPAEDTRDARAQSDTSASRDADLTAPGRQPGTPIYMAPEQHLGETVDARADQFAFCVALYEALWKRRPFPDEGLVRAKLHHRIAMPRRTRGVSRAVTRAIARGLAPRAEDRHPAMADLERALRRPRRRGAVIGLLALGTAALAAVTSPAREPACTAADADAQLRGVWDDDVRARVRARVLEQPRVGAEAWARLDTTFGSYASKWREAWSASCETPSDMHAERMACLARGRRELGALVDALLEDEGRSWSAVSMAALRLRSPETCERSDDGPSLSGEDPARARVLDRLAAVQARIATGPAARAVEASDVAVSAAEALGDRALLARAWLLRGRALARVSSDDAIAALQRAVTEAMTVAAARTEAVARMAIVRHHLVQGRPAHAKALEGEAEAAVVRLDDPGITTQWLVTRSELDAQSGDAAASLTWAERAVEIGRTLPADDPELADAILAHATALAREGRAREAIDAMPEAIAILEARLGPHHPRAASAHYAFGTALYEAGRFEDARREHESALQLRREIFADEHVVVADALMGLAGDRLALGEVGLALEASREALAIYEGLAEGPHPDIARATINVGLVLAEAGELDDALAALRRAQTQYDALYEGDDPRRAEPAYALGTTLAQAGRFDEASIALRTAASLYEHALGAEHPHTMEVRAALADVEREASRGE